MWIKKSASESVELIVTEAGAFIKAPNSKEKTPIEPMEAEALLKGMIREDKNELLDELERTNDGYKYQVILSDYMRRAESANKLIRLLGALYAFNDLGLPLEEETGETEVMITSGKPLVRPENVVEKRRAGRPPGKKDSEPRKGRGERAAELEAERIAKEKAAKLEEEIRIAEEIRLKEELEQKKVEERLKKEQMIAEMRLKAQQLEAELTGG